MGKTRELSDNPNKITTKNAIMNADFDIWQRGTTLSSGSGVRYAADRWYNDSTGSTYSISRQAFTLGQTDVPFEPAYFHRSVVTSSAGSGNYALLRQGIEDVRTFVGETVTLSFYAKADSSKNIAVEFNQDFGTGGSPSASTNGIGVTTCALTTSWKRFEITVDVPSISGKTLGTNRDHRFVPLFWFDAGSTFNTRTNSLGQQSGTFDIAQVQLEKGSYATDLEERSYAEDLALCQRYYEKSFDQYTTPVQGVGTFFGSDVVFLNSGGGASLSPRFKVEKRVAPTVTTYNPTQSNANWRRTDNGNDATATVSGTNTSGFLITAGSGTADGRYAIHWTADAEL